ncbi:hypothetical protein EV193_104403 [Herbihabitans rhizosphaerae]|uniref:Uncharacterized protein n=1 Tax=Herbihabitans rhizosphaerae TaxID=1872711 RepID=A0A4Q7KRS7_9PSEU|nr:hypothetical protein EV193_104403 [Herbihabitans rhizosphaerae]
MIPAMKYSHAPRCRACGCRALLVRDTAEALVIESLGRLEMVECPHSRGGWHVWAPKLETGYART